MDPQQPIDFKTSPNILEDNDLLNFDNNHPSRSRRTSVNSTLPSGNNQANDERQAQAQDPDILELIFQKIAAGFKEATIEVAAAARPSVLPKPDNEGSCPNQPPEVMPAMAPLNENPPVVSALVISAPVMPAPAAPILVNPPQVPLPVAIQDPEPIDMEVTTAQAPMIIRTTAAQSPEQTLLLGMDWFRQTGICLHADERKLYVQCQESDDSDPFDDFEFDDEDLDEVAGFLTDQCSELELYNNLWLDHESPTVYMSGVEGVPVEKTEREEESVIDKLKKNLDNEALTNDQKNHASNVLSKEVDVFAETVDDLGQMLMYVHEINTGSAPPIKQVPYYAAQVCVTS
ncbi:4963_t:CDS:2 [Cetraspora pellucida]|uniref:4963_t:CDS:1 n=1 Tax=Cetraspora pellucida TaxID=1433469 RepID=A0ACA9L5L8_9GLOM|nr:4963_t:CDS:2 [Cetraspora pellucida]